MSWIEDLKSGKDLRSIQAYTRKRRGIGEPEAEDQEDLVLDHRTSMKFFRAMGDRRLLNTLYMTVRKGARVSKTHPDFKHGGTFGEIQWQYTVLKSIAEDRGLLSPAVIKKLSKINSRNR